MFQIIILNVLLTLPILALAQTPIPKVNGQCPSGYYTSEDFCVPFDHSATKDKPVIERRGGSCPPGFQTSGNFCKQMLSSDFKAITKSGKECPRGYRSVDGYCQPPNASWAKDDVIIEKIGGSCPAGFKTERGYCRRFQNSQVEAIPKQPGTKCPYAWRARGNYCVK